MTKIMIASELVKIAKEISSFEIDDNVHRRRSVKVTMSDGDVIKTDINGTKKEIEDYYKKNQFTKEDQYTGKETKHYGVKIEFLG